MYRSKVNIHFLVYKKFVKYYSNIQHNSCLWIGTQILHDNYFWNIVT